MGIFKFNRLKKAKDDGILLGLNYPGCEIEDFQISGDMMLEMFKYCIRLYINKIGGIHKMLYDLWMNNMEKKIHIMIPIEERQSALQPMYYNILSIEKDTSDEMFIHSIFSINHDMVVDSMYESEDGSFMKIYLKFPSRYVEADE